MPAETIDTLYQQYSRKVLATLIRLLGDFELAEEATQEAFYAAIQQWPEQGWPQNPVAWLITTGQRKGIDQIRRRQVARRFASDLQHQSLEDSVEINDDAIADDSLRLIFTCCHPALSANAKLALTLREVCGLTTEQVATALLEKPTTLAQRIVRAKQKIKSAAIPYEIPQPDQLEERLQSVLKVIYLIFNEGYCTSQGGQLQNMQLAEEAIRLCRQLAQLLPGGEVFGLLALMLLQHARRFARQSVNGDLVTLESQDRALWRQDELDEGLQWVTLALGHAPVGVFTLQAAIAAVHTNAACYEKTDWLQIRGLYDLLYQQWPSPVVGLNRAVAIAMCIGPAAGLAEIERLSSHKAIHSYYLYHAATAELYRRAGNTDAARTAYQRALELVKQEPERRFISQQLSKLGDLASN